MLAGTPWWQGCQSWMLGTARNCGGLRVFLRAEYEGFQRRESGFVPSWG